MELDGYNLYFSGTIGVAARGVGLIMQRDVVKSVKCFDPISDRVMRVDLMTERGVLNVVVGYAPTEQSEDEEKDLYYQQLDLAMQKTGSLVIVWGSSMLELDRSDLH